MTDDKKKTADEIVDDLAEEMGVTDSKAPESAQSSDDMMAGLDDIFGVGVKKKKKKKKAPVKEEAPKVEAKKKVVKEDPPETSESDEDEEEEVEAPKKKKKKSAIEGVFATGGDDYNDNDADIFETNNDVYDDDLDDFKPNGGPNKTVIALVLVIVVLAGALLFIVGSKGDADSGEELGAATKLKLILTGEYREYKLARKKRLEEEFEQKQLEGLERYGNLTLDGEPLYARIKLNGKIQYAQTSSGAVRELRLQPGISNFQDLKVKNKVDIEVTSPGFNPFTYSLTEGKWDGLKKDNPKALGRKDLTVETTPISTEAFAEYTARLGSDAENEFYGTITMTSNPAGASIILNNKPLLNEKGEALKTPVTFDKYYTVDEKNKGKFIENPVRVDTTKDLGHKIEIIPPNKNLPKFVEQLERQMWTCTKKDEKEIKKLKLPKEHSVQLECDYSYKMNVDFNAIKAYLDNIEAQRKAVLKKNAEMRKKMEKLRAEKLGMSLEEYTKSKK